jgi:hypothetical protein
MFQFLMLATHSIHIPKSTYFNMSKKIQNAIFTAKFQNSAVAEMENIKVPF